MPKNICHDGKVVPCGIEERATGLVFFAETAGIIALAPLIHLVISQWGWRHGVGDVGCIDVRVGSPQRAL